MPDFYIGCFDTYYFLLFDAMVMFIDGLSLFTPMFSVGVVSLYMRPRLCICSFFQRKRKGKNFFIFSKVFFFFLFFMFICCLV